jgi:putative heme-binding domain-containing protein
MKCNRSSDAISAARGGRLFDAKVAAQVLALMLFAASLLAQGSPVAEGARFFRASCVNCHGERGDMIVGVDLGHGKFRRASTDNDLVGIIINGIPGTGMPPNTLTPPQALGVVAYLRSLSPSTAVVTDDVVNGKALFRDKGCAECHRILGEGSRVGPDLSEIGSLRKPAELEQSILEPDAEIEPDNRTFHATRKDGVQITGRVIDEDTFGMRIIDSKEHLMSLSKADLREYSYSPISGMPSFRGRLTQKEVSHLVGYLSSLKRMDAK